MRRPKSSYWTERDRMALAYYYKYRILKQFMARDLEGCIASARVIDENFNVVMGMAFSAYYLPYQSLALIGLLPKMAGGARLAAMRTIRRNQRRLRTWSRHAPENYLHKWVLVNAELARLGRPRLGSRARLSGGDSSSRAATGPCRTKHWPMNSPASSSWRAVALPPGAPIWSRRAMPIPIGGRSAWVDHLERRHGEIIRAERAKGALDARVR